MKIKDVAKSVIDTIYSWAGITVTSLDTIPYSEPTAAVAVENPEPPKEELPPNIVWQGILLEDNEVLVYTDEHGEKHLVSKHPVNKNTKYRIITMTADDVARLS